MAGQDVSPERNRAFYRLKEAEQPAAKGHLEEAIGIARDALAIDPTFVEARHWIAAHYEKAGEPRKAAAEYQDIIHGDRDDAVAWERLRVLDPAAAERLDRLHNIAPDPFVMARTENMDSLDDLAGLAEELPAAEEEVFVPGHEAGAEITDDLGDLAGTDAIGEMVGSEEVSTAHEVAFADMGVEDAEGEDWSLDAPEEPAAESEPVAADEPAPAPVVVEAAPAPAAAAGPPAWLYEEDLKYRDLMAQQEFVSGMYNPVVELWNDTGLWDTEISGLAHLDKHRHEAVVSAFEQAQAVLGGEPWALFFSPERRMVPTILRGNPAVATVTTGIMNSLKPEEMLFLAGRLTTFLVAGHVPWWQIAYLILDRTPRNQTDVESDLIELLREKHSGVVGLHRDERLQLATLCHAWQMRAELSADRGGLICCRDLEAACTAIARLTSLDANAAQMASWRALKDKLKGQDLNQLLLFPPKEDPIRNEGFAYYRIRMLRWWAGTEAAQAWFA
jgi:hypothetical protein